ncbi:hypothetical protein ACLOJK_019027 [Asimina triloba]
MGGSSNSNPALMGLLSYLLSSLCRPIDATKGEKRIRAQWQPWLPIAFRLPLTARATSGASFSLSVSIAIIVVSSFTVHVKSMGSKIRELQQQFSSNGQPFVETSKQNFLQKMGSKCHQRQPSTSNNPFKMGQLTTIADGSSNIKHQTGGRKGAASKFGHHSTHFSNVIAIEDAAAHNVKQQHVSIKIQRDCKVQQHGIAGNVT